MSKEEPSIDMALLRTLKLFKWKETQPEDTFYKDAGLFLFCIHGVVFIDKPGSEYRSSTKVPERKIVIPFKLEVLQDPCILPTLTFQLVSATRLFGPKTVHELAMQVCDYVRACYCFHIDTFRPSTNSPRLIFVADIYTIRKFEASSTEKLVAPMHDLEGNDNVNYNSQDHDGDGDLIGDSDMDIDDDNDNVADAVQNEEDRTFEVLVKWDRKEFEDITAALIRAYRGIERTFQMVQVGPKLEHVKSWSVEGKIDATDVCAICLEGLTTTPWLIKLHCQHVFHHFCIFKWIRDKGSCPLCRSCTITCVHNTST